MPEILIFYFAGLSLCAVVAWVFYFAVGGSMGLLMQRILGPRTGAMWGRSFRILMFLMTFAGGLSTKWYGCDGYSDYQAIAADRRLMLEQSTLQVAGSINYARTFLFIAAGTSAIVIALLARRPSKSGTSDADEQGNVRSAEM